MVNGFHFFGSRTWYDKNWPLVQGLGEDLTFPHTWTSGLGPGLLPRNKIVGTTDCLANGDFIDEATPDEDLVDGFPSECFVFPQENLVPWLTVSEVNVCSMQRFYAAVINWLYDDDATHITEGFELLLGPGYTITVHPVVANFPAVVTCVGNGIFVAVLDGTRNFQQIALQGLYSLQSPTDFGQFGTNPFWMQAANYIHNILITDGLARGMRFMVAGHSYGAAVALILAATYKQWGALADVRYLTFGCPKPGDQRLQDILIRVDGLNLANDDDLVTVFPPDYLTLLPVMIALGAPQIAVWRDWQRPENQFELHQDGTGEPNGFPLLDYTTLFAVAQNVLTANPLNPITGHTMVEYARRLNLRCPGNIWPVTVPLDDLIDDTVDMLLEDLTTMQLEDITSMYLEPE